MLLTIGLDEVDESVGGRIVRRYRVIVLELGLDGFGQLLAQFYAPLIIRVDVPDHALSEDFVFV